MIHAEDRLEKRWEDSIHCHIEQQGRDYIVRLIGGGDHWDHHIGAVTTAYYTESLWVDIHNFRDHGVIDAPKVAVMTHVVPGHQEAILSEPMAREAALVLGATVTVLAGIHYDQLQAQEIEAVVEAAWRVFRESLTQSVWK